MESLGALAVAAEGLDAATAPETMTTGSLDS